VTFEQIFQIDEEENHMDTYGRIVQAEEKSLRKTMKGKCA